VAHAALALQWVHLSQKDFAETYTRFGQSSFEYDVVTSFGEPDRAIAKEISQRLKRSGLAPGLNPSIGYARSTEISFSEFCDLVVCNLKGPSVIWLGFDHRGVTALPPTAHVDRSPSADTPHLAGS
jgi:hypothetical protein